MTAASDRRKREAITTHLNDATMGWNDDFAQEVADAAVVALEREGWVILRAESVRQAAERAALARHRQQWAEDEADHARQWARDSLQAERRLADRCTFLYGAARARGATVEDLAGPA